MPDNNFTHLHVHSEFSILDGAAKLAPLVAEVQRLGQSAVAITDHGTLGGVHAFYTQAVAAGIKPIAGIECYVSPGSRYHKKPVFWGHPGQRSDDVSGAGAYTHMTLWAENPTGLRNLFRLSSRASIQGLYRKPRCLLPGQEIVTRLGMTSIDDLRVGDQVLTHRGRFRPVTRIMNTLHHGDIYGLRLNGAYNRITWMTGEHPVLIRDRSGIRTWISARNIVPGRPGTGTRESVNYWNSWACLPRPRSDSSPVTFIDTANYVSWTPLTSSSSRFYSIVPRRAAGPTRHYANLARIVELDYDFGFFLGLYLSEGHIDRRQCITWSFHKDEQDLVDSCSKLIEKYTGKIASIRYRLDRPRYNGVDVVINSTLLSQLVHTLCSSGKCNRLHMPSFTFEAPRSFMEGIFNGVLAGDGSKTRPGVVGLTVTSQRLSWQMRTLAVLLRSDFSGIYNPPLHSDRHARQYGMYFSPAGRCSHRKTISDESYVYRPISKVEHRQYAGVVYNIEVAEDNSYVTDFALHNCDTELLAQHAGGIIATTGCPSGEVQTRLRLGQPRQALEAAAAYRDIFGAGNFYLELMDHGLSIERSVREGLLDIGRRLNLPPVATNDSHYVREGDAAAHDALLCVQTGGVLTEETRFRFEGSGYYLKSTEEMRGYWDGEVPGACDTTLAIAERVGDYSEVFTPRNRMPTFPVPEGHTQASYLEQETIIGLTQRIPGGVPEAYRQRAAAELGLITSAGFPAYFLIVADLTAWAHTQGIRIGPGRGSVAGSLVAYALGITDIDPMVHGLLFERFLNPERTMMPDIDLDFDERRRDEVMAYVTRRYGSDHVAMVGTYGHIGARQAVRDATRIEGLPYSLGDRICKAMPPTVMGVDTPLSAVTDTTHPRHPETRELRDLITSDPDTARVMDTARGLEGLIRQVGVHASGLIISAEPLIDVVPLWARDDGSVITQWDFPTCEDMGLLKVDCLGLRNLTVIDDTLTHIRDVGQTVPDLDTLPLNDPGVYKLLARGETLGVFQLDGTQLQRLLHAIGPTQFTDLSVALALYRPGPMGAGTHTEYADRKNGRKPGSPIHPELAEPLADILDETWGLVCFQEQVMAIAGRVAGYSLGRADLLRKAMGKKKPEILAKEYAPFSDGMRANGYSEECITTLWDLLVPFSSYGFGKAHSACYALLAYWTAYLKAHYPSEYMAALLTSVGDDKDKMRTYLTECRRLGIRVLPPCVNTSGAVFAPAPVGIRFGLGAVADVGSKVVDAILAARARGGPYRGFPEFLRRLPKEACNKRGIESLIKAGAFDALGYPRRGLLEVYGPAIDRAVASKPQESAGQLGLFAADEEAFTVPIPPGEWEPRELLAHEREVLGLYVSAHPLDGVWVALQGQVTTLAQVLASEPRDGASVRVGGLLTGVDRKTTKQGRRWARCHMEDSTGEIELLVFPQAYDRLGAHLVDDEIVLVTARINTKDERVSLIVEDLTVPDLTTLPVVVEILATECTPQWVEQFREEVAKHPGDHPVRVHVLRDDGSPIIMEVNQRWRVTPEFALEVKL